MGTEIFFFIFFYFYFFFWLASAYLEYLGTNQ